MKKDYWKVYDVVTDSDVKASVQIAKVTITSNKGTHRGNDVACLVLEDIDGMTLATTFTDSQLTDFINRLRNMKMLLEQCNNHRGINCPL